MYGEILSIGTELLMGEIVDTNAAYLASRLPAFGIELRWVSQVGDNVAHLAEALQRALGRSDITFTTGGLGPTQDDLTREAIAQALGETMQVDPGLLEGLKSSFASRGMPMPASNMKQASLIPSAQAIPNPRGTAPGWWVQTRGRTIVAMPGPPGEMDRMWENEVSPRLRQMATGLIILSRTIKTIGLPEAGVADLLHDLFGKENPYLGIYAKPDGIHLRIIAKAQNEAEAQRLAEPFVQEMRRRLGPAIWGVDQETPEVSLGALLQARGLSLATMESCTGGLLASTITDAPGSSGYFRGGLVTYTNEAKASYGVDSALIRQLGAVSPQVAEAMAQAARRQLGADLGIGVTGVAGPSELEGVPPGTVHIGVAWNELTRAASFRYPPQRNLVKHRAVVQAILEAQRLLQQERV